MKKERNLEDKLPYYRIKKQIRDVYEEIAQELSERLNYSKKYSVK